ncbi:MAG: MerR family transcriptional regulator [Erysipelotrichaceae bacterium]|nr:MerR family transcriptional regulator [Erysipelotrichaceae bacterium]
MRIQEVSKKTGLSKKAIHFYVNEGLIQPKKCENNYYEFSDQEIMILNQIHLFRMSGLSIQTIKEIYNYPAATNFFLHRSFNQLKMEIAEKINQLENLEMILETIPPNGTPVDVGQLPLVQMKSEIDTSRIDQMHPSIDERMITILLLAPFMHVQVDEYKTYLWDKIFNDLKYQFKDNLSILTKLIYTLSGTQIRESSIYQFNLMNELASADTLDKYVDYMMDCIAQMCTDTELQQKWKLLYLPVLTPVKNFFKRTSEKKRISQYNPLFEQCSSQLAIIINQTLKRLAETELQNQLLNCLDHQFTFSEDVYNDLFLLFTFHKSIYAQCSLQDINNAVS